MLAGKHILVLGAGDLATGVIRRLHLAGASVVATELPAPLTVRRQVAFSQAVHDGAAEVEGVKALRCDPNGIDDVLAGGAVAVVVDPERTVAGRRRFDALVDARIAKRNLGLTSDLAPAVVAVGPGYRVGPDCHAVVETLQGMGMGSVLWEGEAAPDTGKPCGFPGGERSPWERVVRAPRAGRLRTLVPIGATVEKDAPLANVSGEPAAAPFSGIVRGLVNDGLEVSEGLKIGEVEVTEKAHRVFRVSEKANAVAGGVLEALFTLFASAAH